jgi:hypothetical protein
VARIARRRSAVDYGRGAARSAGRIAGQRLAAISGQAPARASRRGHRARARRRPLGRFRCKGAPASSPEASPRAPRGYVPPSSRVRHMSGGRQSPLASERLPPSSGGRRGFRRRFRRESPGTRRWHPPRLLREYRFARMRSSPPCGVASQNCCK